MLPVYAWRCCNIEIRQSCDMLSLGQASWGFRGVVCHLERIHRRTIERKSINEC